MPSCLIILIWNNNVVNTIQIGGSILFRPLLNIPVPYHEEILSSYLSRILLYNNYVRKSYINTYLKIQPLQYGKEKSCAASLNYLCNLTNDEINKLFFHDIAFENISKNTFFQKYALFNTETRICPHCLLNGGYYRKIWCLRLYTSCHIHNCLMIGQCTCGEKISRISTNLFNCSCGREYSSLQPEQIPNNGSHNAFVYLKILNRSKSDENVNNHPFNNLQTDLFCELMLRYANFLNKIENKKSDWAFIRDTNLLEYLLNQVYTLFSDWPVSFEKFLNQCEKQGELDILLRMTLLYFNTEQYKFLITEVAQYVEKVTYRNGILNVSRTVINKLNENNGLFVSKERAKSMLNITNNDSLIENMIVEKKIITLTLQSEKRAFRFISCESIKEIVRQRFIKCSIIEARKILGVYNSEIDQLINSGLIYRVEGSQHLFREGIESIIKLFEDNLLPPSHYKGYTSISVREITEVSSLRVVDIIKLAKNRIISPVGKGGKGLLNYLFDRKEITDVFIRFNIDATVQLIDAAVILKIPVSILKEYIDEGLLKSQRRKKVNNGKQVVHLNEIKNFQTRYFIMQDLVQGVHQDKYTLSRALSLSSIFPVSRKIINTQYEVFTKSSIEKYMLMQIRDLS